MNNDRDLPQSPAVCNFFRPAQFEAAHPNIFDRPGRLNTWLRYRDGNGLVECGAVFNRGKLLFINAQRFAEWLSGVIEDDKDQDESSFERAWRERREYDRLDHLVNSSDGRSSPCEK